jgi:two-component system NarL family sensor kinase
MSASELGAPGSTERELALLGSVADALSRETDARASLERTLEIVSAHLDLETGWIWLLDPQTQDFYLAAARNLPPYLQEPVQMTGEQCWCMESFFDGDFVSDNVDVIECSRLRKGHRSGAEALTGGLRYHASVALRFGDRQLGIMNLTRKHWRPLSKHDLQLLSTIGSQVGLAIERARLADETATLARSDERARMAREIHDTLAQDLTAIALQLESALRRLPDEGETRERIDQALAVARDSLRRARESVLNLRSDPLDGKPLPVALSALVRRFTSRTGILATFSGAVTVPLTHAAEVELYRIATEALTNVERHARAHRVDVRVDAEGADLVLAIADDGVGYDAASPEANRYGVVGMAERARGLGGTFSVTRGEGGSGTVVRVRVPNAPA